MTSEGRPDQRAVARELIERARDDQSFARRLRADPVGTLAHVGLPAEGADDVLRETPRDPGTAERPCMFTCSWTCIVTGI
jgi:hypothetical protein